MAASITLDIPEVLHDRLRHRAEILDKSIQTLIVQVLEDTYMETKVAKGERVTGPMIQTKLKLGPRFPVDENPYDLIFP
jgi:hypothetical protein